MPSKEEKGTEKELAVREKKELRSQQGTRQGLYFEPDVDIWEDETSMTLMADVPGATENGIEIDLRDNVLTMTASVEDLDSRWKPIWGEYRVGHYTRSFRLGQAIDQSGISAKLRDGVLEVKLPKVREAQPRKIQIQVG